MAKNKPAEDRMKSYSNAELSEMKSIYNMSVPFWGGPVQSHLEVRNKKGWMIPVLQAQDHLLWKRWTYWSAIIEKGTIVGSGPIPQIEWYDMSHAGVKEAFKMLSTCLSHHEANMDNFADWILWGFSHGEFPRISEELNNHFYRNFVLDLLQMFPTDYFSHVLTEETGKGYKQGLGYYPTPPSICQLVAQIEVSGQDPEELKKKSVYDSCVGCGAMLLPMSNHMFKAYAQDISAIAIKLCRIQFYIYAPWFATGTDMVTGFENEAPIVIPSTSQKAIQGQLMFSF